VESPRADFGYCPLSAGCIPTPGGASSSLNANVHHIDDSEGGSCPAGCTPLPEQLNCISE
jgi:hypothetical protein